MLDPQDPRDCLELTDLQWVRPALRTLGLLSHNIYTIGPATQFFFFVWPTLGLPRTESLKDALPSVWIDDWINLNNKNVEGATHPEMDHRNIIIAGWRVFTKQMGNLIRNRYLFGFWKCFAALCTYLKCRKKRMTYRFFTHFLMFFFVGALWWCPVLIWLTDWLSCLFCRGPLVLLDLKEEEELRVHQ